MSRSHDGHWPHLPFSNPFRMILPKGSYLSPELSSLLNSFEKTLAYRFKYLKPKESSGVLSLLWMRVAVESLCEAHTDIKLLITDLQFPVSDWDGKWMDMYLDTSVKLLDICIAFSSKLSHISQSQLFLQHVLHVLDSSKDSLSKQHIRQARGLLHNWMQQINCSSPRFENSSSILKEFTTSLHLTKVKNSSKGKVLMQAMYGVKVLTIFVFTVFSTALSGSQNLLMDLHVSENFLWAEAFKELQDDVVGQIRRSFPHGRPVITEELATIDECVEKLLALTRNILSVEGNSLHISSYIDDRKPENLQETDSLEDDQTEALLNCVLKLDKSSQCLADVLELLAKQVDGFFQIVVSGRDALLCNLRAPDVMEEDDVEESRL